MRNALARSIRNHQVRWTHEEIADLLAEYRASGNSQMAFARSRGISQSTLSYWLRTARQRNADKVEEAPRLVPVRIADVPTELSAPTRPGFELDLPNALRLWIPADFDETALRRLLPILAGRC